MYKFKHITSKQYDVLIVDEIGSDVIINCLPENCTYYILPTRNVIPWIAKIKFILNIIKMISKKYNIKSSVLLSVVSVINPKILITFIDNSPVMGLVNEVFPDKLSITVQSGMRSKMFGFNKKGYQVLYGFGKFEEKLLNFQDIKVDEYVAAGSVKQGLSGKYIEYSETETDSDICYLSSFVGGLLNSDTKVSASYLQYDKLFFSSLVDICKNNSLRLTIAMRSEKSSEAYHLEYEYFKEMDPDNIVKMIPNNKKSYRSYNTANSAKVVFCTFSTLGFEMFGVGKKVLFGASANNFDLAEEYDAKWNFENLPSLVLLSELKMDNISKKLKKLLYMEQEDYLLATKESSKYYMNTTLESPPHKVIKKRIFSYLNNM
jgi:surface carbohydrate biosynthesis protein